jgi:hypothetical protein
MRANLERPDSFHLPADSGDPAVDLLAAAG